MLKALRSAVLAAGLVIAPLAATATPIAPGDSVTLSTSASWDWTGRFTSTVAPTDTTKVPPPTTLSWTFTNAFKSTRIVGLSGFINEQAARFGLSSNAVADGNGGTFSVVTSSGTTVLLNSRRDNIRNDSDALNTELIFAAGETKTLQFTFKPAYASTTGVAQAGFTATVAPVPVPAAGGLLATGLLGLAALRRRRKAA